MAVEASRLNFEFSFDKDILSSHLSLGTDTYFDICASNSAKCGLIFVSEANDNFSDSSFPNLSLKRRLSSHNSEKFKPKSARLNTPKNHAKRVAPKQPITMASNEQIQSGFQQNPGDLIGVLQSLETGEKIFSCKLCGQQGKQKVNIERHVVVKHMQHLKETFQCSICERTLSSKYKLKGHYMSAHNMNEKLATAALTV